MARRQTQRDRVLKHLESGETLTVRDAVLLMNINCLPKRIEELRKMGYPITMEWVTNGHDVRYGVYKMGR